MNGVFSHGRMAQTIFNLAKDYTATTMQIMKTSIELHEKTLEAMLKQGAVIQDEGHKLLSDLINRAKQGQQQYWNLIEENLKKMNVFFNTDTQKKKM